MPRSSIRKRLVATSKLGPHKVAPERVQLCAPSEHHLQLDCFPRERRELAASGPFDGGGGCVAGEGPALVILFLTHNFISVDTIRNMYQKVHERAHLGTKTHKPIKHKL